MYRSYSKICVPWVSTSRLVLVEGNALLPDEIAPLLRSRERGVWLIPTQPFQERSYARRMWVPGILQQCASPEVAFRNWMGRDAAFARWVAKQVHDHGLTSIRVDGSHSVEQIADRVASHFGFLAAK